MAKVMIMDSDGKVSNKVSIGVCFKRGWDVFWKNWVAFVVAELLSILICVFSVGICFAPMMVGLCMMALAALREDKKVAIGDVFQGFNKFGQAFVVFLVFGFAAIIGGAIIAFVVGFVGGLITTVLSIIPVIGTIIGLLLSIVLWAVGYVVDIPFVTCGRWALLKIADGEESIGKAISDQMNELTNGQFWSVILVFAVAWLISWLGWAGLGVGVLFTSPLSVCIVASAYEEAYSRKAVSEAQPAPEAEPVETQPAPEAQPQA